MYWPRWWSEVSLTIQSRPQLFRRPWRTSEVVLSVGLGFLVSVIEITVVDRIVLLAETIDVSFLLVVECPFALREFCT